MSGVTFDEAGRVLTVTRTWGKAITNFRFEYNEANLLARETMTGRMNHVLNFFYNDNQDIIRMESSWDNNDPSITEYEYVYY